MYATVAGINIFFAVFAKELNTIADNLNQSAQQFTFKQTPFEIGAIKSAHLKWKLQLEAVLVGRKKMHPKDVTNHHECEFGKWYDNVSGTLTNNALFQEIAVHHKIVHETAKKIVGLYNQDKEEVAQKKLIHFRMDVYCGNTLKRVGLATSRPTRFFLKNLNLSIAEIALVTVSCVGKVTKSAKKRR